MKQLSSSELNSMTKEEMAAMILQMQQTQLQLQQQVHKYRFMRYLIKYL